MKRLLLIILLTNFIHIFSIDYTKLPDDELYELAETGDKEAQYNLALLIEDLIYTKNYQRLDYVERKPFVWYEKAAIQGYPKALTRVGKEYLDNYGYYKKKDINKAIELFTQASDSDQEASLLLAIINYNGIGIPANKERGKQLLEKSQKDFFRVKPMLYLEKELVEMVRELVKENNPNALFILGDFYYFGKTGYYEQSYDKALRLYSQGAELGNSSATYMLGMMYYNGIGVLKDINESFKWINLSAESGNLSAIIKAGIMNYFGEGTTVDYEAALKWFTMGALKMDSLSQYFIGVMYYKGEGTEQNIEQSKKWIKKAFENGSESAKKFWDSKELWK
ncbi:MAG: sel1 repeat family protein [Spirochaetales bacterium]|nr:sel1 repeat family protein [Spirochaetales bacterium]